MIRFLQESGAFKKYFLGAILVVICISMAWYLVPSFSGQSFGMTAVPAVATVSGQDVTVAEVQRQARQMIDQQGSRLGAQAAMLMPYFTQAAQQLINEKVLLYEANRMGLRASDDDVRDFLHHGQLGETLFPGGNFAGEQAYQDLASRLGFTIPQLEQAIKDDIVVNKLRAIVTGTASISDTEIKQQFEKQNTKVKFDYAVIKKDDILKTIKPADAELRAYYDRNKQTYVNSIPERRQLK